jgi:hypothetical protein
MIQGEIPGQTDPIVPLSSFSQAVRQALFAVSLRKVSIGSEPARKTRNRWFVLPGIVPSVHAVFEDIVGPLIVGDGFEREGIVRGCFRDFVLNERPVHHFNDLSRRQNYQFFAFVQTQLLVIADQRPLSEVIAQDVVAPETAFIVEPQQGEEGGGDVDLAAYLGDFPGFDLFWCIDEKRDMISTVPTFYLRHDVTK